MIPKKPNRERRGLKIGLFRGIDTVWKDIHRDSVEACGLQKIAANELRA